MLTLNLHLFVCLVSLLLLLFEDDGLYIVVFALLAALFEVVLWARRERRANTLNWCHPVPVFALGYCIVYYQLPFCYHAGFDLSYYSNYVIFSPHNVSYCVLLASLGLSAFFCGEQILTLRRRPFQVDAGVRSTIDNQILQNASTKIKNANSAILFLTIIFFLFYLKSIGLGSYFGFAYGSKSNPAFSTHLNFLYTIFLYIAILLDFSRLIKTRPTSFIQYLRTWDVRVLLVTLFTIVPYVLSGDRGSYLQPLALIVIPYFVLSKPMKLFKSMAIATTMAFILVVVGDTRGRMSVSWTDALTARIASVANPAAWPTIELANSFGTFNIATGYFPQKYEYQNGVKTLYSIASLIPFSSFFTDVRKKNLESDYVLSSSLFFTNILTQGTFSSGSGTSTLADIYIDFGPYGIPIVLFLWGMFMAWICRNVMISQSSNFVFLYSYYSYVNIYVNRSTFFTGFNHLIWVFLIVFFIKRLYLERSSL